MTKNFWKIVNKVIHDSDILIEVLDARFPELSRNEEIEAKIRRLGKTLIYVVNKVDLVRRHHLQTETVPNPFVIFAAPKRRGLRELRSRIMIEAKRCKKKDVMVGVLGYPNTGKSSVINALKGRRAAPNSPRSGFTKALMKVRVTNSIRMLDTPGVFPFSEKDEVKHSLLGARNPEKLQYPEDAAEVILSKYADMVTEQYQCAANLEALAERWGKKKKGGVLDLKGAAIKVLHEWQTGKLHGIAPEEHTKEQNRERARVKGIKNDEKNDRKNGDEYVEDEVEDDVVTEHQDL